MIGSALTPCRLREEPDAVLRLNLDATRARQVLRPAGGNDPSAREDHDPVADELDLAEQVRVEQNADLTPAQLLEQRANGSAARRVERARRLVEEQHRRRAHQSLRDAEPLLHALRHLVHAHLAGLREPDELEQVSPLLLAARRRDEPLMQAEHLVGRVPPREAEELREVAERGPRRGRPGRRAEELGPALGRPDQPARDLDER
jgi:hypothetical protein